MAPSRFSRLRWVVPAFALALTACASAPSPPPEPNPCTEPLYLRLKAAEPDSLSEREFERLRDMDQACREYRQQDAARQHTDDGMMGMMGGRSGRWWMTGAMVVAVMAAMMLWRL